MPQPFPQFSGFPPEIQIMIWNEFIRIETANRLVFLVECEDYERDRSADFHSAGFRMANSMRLLPSRWLVSPLLSVNTQARDIALEHYHLCIDVFDQPSLPFTYSWCDPMGMDSEYSLEDREAREDTWVRPLRSELERPPPPRARPRYRFLEEPEWLSRHILGMLSEWTAVGGILRGLDLWDPVDRDVTACRGCVYLNPATDRFTEHHSHMENKRLGLRSLTNAQMDFKYHAIPFDVLDILNHRCPAPLLYASAALSKRDVLDRVRNVVLAKGPTARGTAPDGRVVVNVTWAARHSPQALGSEGCQWMYDASEEVNRTFFDDVEDKGAEHLLLRAARVEAIESNRGSEHYGHVLYE